MIYSFGGLPYDLGARTRIMGILNVTPDSFSDGGRYTDRTTAVEHALEMAGEGADFIDIGGESTRPGATPVAPDVEIRRVVPVIEALAAKSGIPISVDTRNADVAERALGAGASIVNDISGLRHDPRMAGVVGTRGGSAVLMHMRGTSATMQDDPRYDDLIGEIRTCFLESIRLATEAGIRQIILDPGIGFGKTTGHNLEILSRLGEFADLGYPLMVGPSRKAFVGAILELPVGERLEGTIGASVAAVMRGARLLRVHDVREVSRAVRIADAILARNHA
ncbi:MAG TPA: dihydropteroate synthase [Bacteroidota bacterium]|nr:dihydropteroate synthase [Bacteroidota bacterium]